MKGWVAVTAILLTSCSVVCAQVSPLVRFADPKLKAAVEAELGHPVVTIADMAGLTELYIEESGVSDLTGLEYAINLE